MIDYKVLYSALNINLSKKIVFNSLGLSNSTLQNTLSFCDNIKFIQEINENDNIGGLFVTKVIKGLITKDNIAFIVVDDPRFCFYTLQNYVSQLNYKKVATVIGKNCEIHKSSFVSDFNVIIGNNVIIEPNVTVLADVEINDNVIIRSGTVIGAEGFEHKKTTKGLLAVKHDGRVIIYKNVHIGANNAISKGFSYRNTIIGEDSKTDNLVHIAHGAQIGKRCLLPASCMIAGSVTIEDDVWIGPNASISSQIHIGKSAYISIGAVVTTNIADNKIVSGNFAIDHKKFINFIKTIR
jgi:acetyltransferase-like isoleucine patch superfamily enzyme